MSAALLNLAAFKIGWIAVVFAAASGKPWAGIAVVAVVVIVHLLRTPRASAELVVLVAASVIGFAWESILVALDLVDYGSGIAHPAMAPFWIVAMWVLFATTLNVGMRWMRRSTFIAALAGGVGGPLAFAAGERAGAVEFGDPMVSLAAVAVGWTLLLPLLVVVAERFDGYAAHPVPSSARDGARGGAS